MGCPHAYYVEVLQNFAHALAYDDDVKLARDLYENASEEKLEEFILQKKECTDPASFYFDAGQAARLVLMEAEEAGSDGATASCGGINEFMRFIGLKI